MRRRAFITVLVSAAMWPLGASAQQRAMPVVGVLHGGSPKGASSMLASFSKGLSEMGFAEGRNLTIDVRLHPDPRFPLSELVADLIGQKVDVIATRGCSKCALAAKALTTTIPIVFSTSGDPVKLGLVTNLARPRGNVTGYTDMSRKLCLSS